MAAAIETFYEVIRRQGITRRSFVKFCSLTATSLGLGPVGASQIANALETKPRVPVIWMHGLECTCCSESFIRSAHPLVKEALESQEDRALALFAEEREASFDRKKALTHEQVWSHLKQPKR